MIELFEQARWVLELVTLASVVGGAYLWWQFFGKPLLARKERDEHHRTQTG